MSTINANLDSYVRQTKRKLEQKYPLAGRKPTVEKKKLVVSEHISVKRRPVTIRETK